MRDTDKVNGREVTECDVKLVLLLIDKTRVTDKTYKWVSVRETKSEESTRLGYTELIGELEHLKIKMRLIMMGGKTVYHISRKWDVKIRLMNESQWDERLKVGVQEDVYLTYTGLYDKTN